MTTPRLDPIRDESRRHRPARPRSARRLAARWLLAAAATVAAVPGLAMPHGFSFWQGPAEMIIPENDFRQFHSTLTNVGDLPDSYTMTVTRQQPAPWFFAVCYEGVCWPADQTVFRIPTAGDLFPTEVMDFEFDVISFGAAGEAVYSVHIVSNSNPTVQTTRQFTARTPTQPYALLLSPGETLIGTTVNDFVRFEPVLYNAGTQPDRYRLTMTRNLPANWSATFCFDGVCYPPQQSESDIPAGAGQVPGAGAVPLEIDFFTMFDAGTGSVTVTITSLTQPSLTAQATFTVTTNSLTTAPDAAPALLSGLQAAPNPFNPRTDIRFDLGGETARDVALVVYDARGRQVRRLGAGTLLPGRHSVAWDGLDEVGESVPAGAYLVQVRSGAAQQTLKLSLVK